MVALLKPKPREPRQHLCGPIYHDQPLRVFDEDAADLADNLKRPVPWTVEMLFALGLFLFVACPAAVAVFLAWGM